MTRNSSTDNKGDYSYRQIWSLAWPLMLANISVPLLGIVDTAILGHLQSPRYLAAIALGASIIALVFSGLNFLRMSATGSSAQALGADNPQLIVRNLMQGALIAAVLSTTILMASPLITKAGLAFTSPSNELAPLFSRYVQIRLLAVPAVLANFVIIGWVIGQQRPSIALAITVVTNLSNIVLDYVFILVLELNSDGAAWASIIAEYSGFITGLFLLNHYFPMLRHHWSLKKSPVFHWHGLLTTAITNINIFVRSLCLLLVFAFFNTQSEKLGMTTLAANAILLQLILLQSYALDGFANATEALVGKVCGAQQYDQLASIQKQTFIVSLITALILVLIFLISKAYIASLFTNNSDLLTTVNQWILWICLAPAITFWAYWLDGIAIGKSSSRAMRNGMLLSCLVFLLSGWLLQAYGNTGLWLAFFIFSFFRGLLMLPVLCNTSAQ